MTPASCPVRARLNQEPEFMEGPRGPGASSIMSKVSKQKLPLSKALTQICNSRAKLPPFRCCTASQSRSVPSDALTLARLTDSSLTLTSARSYTHRRVRADFTSTRKKFAESFAATSFPWILALEVVGRNLTGREV